MEISKTFYLKDGRVFIFRKEGTDLKYVCIHQSDFKVVA